MRIPTYLILITPSPQTLPASLLVRKSQERSLSGDRWLPVCLAQVVTKNAPPVYGCFIRQN